MVQPVPQKGDCSNPSNYRPIALTSTIAKVFESILNSHFLKHLESHSLLSDHQYGFRKARSTGDLLSYLTHVWSTALRNFGESYVVALDISKAFDRVWHKALLAKLPSFGFTPSLTKFIASFLSNRTISVVVDSATYNSFPVTSGVPQGTESKTQQPHQQICGPIRSALASKAIRMGSSNLKYKLLLQAPPLSKINLTHLIPSKVNIRKMVHEERKKEKVQRESICESDQT